MKKITQNLPTNKIPKETFKKNQGNSNYPPIKQNKTEVWLFLPSRLSAQSLRGPHWGSGRHRGLVKCFGLSWGLGSGPLHLSPSLVHLGAHTVHMGRGEGAGELGGGMKPVLDTHNLTGNKK